MLLNTKKNKLRASKGGIITLWNDFFIIPHCRHADSGTGCSGKTQGKGIALLGAILIMSLILFLSLYFLNFSVTENRIAKGQTAGAKAYYLAEAGAAHMVWKLKNDGNYKTNFETNSSWTTNFTQNNPFGAGSGTYTVTITNSEIAHGTIESVGLISVGGKTSQRIVRTNVFRAMGENPVGSTGGYADGNIDISYSKVNFYNGNAHSNLNFIANGSNTVVNISNDLEAVGNFEENQNADVNVAGTIYAANRQPAASEIQMPAVDFDSANPNSYKSRATIVYDEDEFEDLLRNNQNLTLPGPITYVTGEIEIKGARNLTINGLLVAEEEIEIGESRCWEGGCGDNIITVNHTVGQPAGILSKEKIKFDYYTGTVNISGAVYANDQLNITNIPNGRTFNVIGGLISRKLTITSVWSEVNITFDNDILAEALGAELSPIITVEHWEEEY